MSDTFESISFRDESGLPPNWKEGANCKGMPADVFHPRRGQDASRAKAICIGCVALESCLHYALSNHIMVGVWGGTSERQRRAMRREIVNGQSTQTS